MAKGIRKLIYPVSGILIVLAGWCLLSLVMSESLVPFPWSVVRRAVELCLGSTVIPDLFITVGRGLAGFLMALAVGTVVGLLCGRYRGLDKALFFPVSFFQGAPAILWILPLMLLLGTGGASPVFVVFFVVLPLVLVNLREGMAAVPENRWHMMRLFGNSLYLKLFRFLLPALAPQFKTIFILGVMLALKSTLVGEWFAAGNGIGRSINVYFYNFNMTSFYAESFLFLIFLYLITLVIKRLSGKWFSPRKTPFKTEAKLSLDVKKRTGSMIVEKLSFSYIKGKAVLRDVDLLLKEHQTHVLTGDSGIGKTTFARLACRLIKPEKGRIHGPDVRGMVFQEDIFLDHLDCLGNVMLPLEWKKVPGRVEQAAALLTLCGLKEVMHYFPGELSGGMKKRLSLARALALDPDFIILDEPFAQLDREGREGLWELFFNLFPGRGVLSLIITHFPEELKERDIRLYTLREGRIFPVS